jgi:hypothetical protein
MTGVILIGAPVVVVLGCLYWVLSFSKEQDRINAERWKAQGLK